MQNEKKYGKKLVPNLSKMCDKKNLVTKMCDKKNLVTNNKI